MEADIQQLYSSSICSVHNFLCRCEGCTVSENEYQEQFVIAYVRRGNFQFKTFNNDLDACHGFFLLNKPGYEYKVGHVHHLPDECTIFYLSDENVDLLRQGHRQLAGFFNNVNIQTILIKATPETECLHHHILQLLLKPHYPKLWVESLISQLFIEVLSGHHQQAETSLFTYSQKKIHLPVIEKVKLYINEHFTEDISLSQLSNISSMSLFHFNRFFKRLTTFTPYQYMVRVRLEQAHLHICNTSLSITEIAFRCGFNSLEHFSAAYKQMHGKAPSAVRFKMSNFS